MTILFSCEELRKLTIDCTLCKDSDMTTAALNIKTDTRFGDATINVYEGDLEDNIKYSQFRTASENMTISVPVNRKFTVTATYIIGGDNYIAVDSAEPHVGYDKDTCDEPCYYVYNNSVNLKLKYLK